ncbi:MAG: Dihydroorotase, homodimeric type [Parcubacteria group bacterium GW2011_GWA2_49_9]|nr:MAG: Dihydroorotase, homodimeric type [Parcubacteria group bacterium GW2011_GWA2_49_9]
MNIQKKRRSCDFHTHLRSIAEVGKKIFEFIVKLNTSGYKHVVAEPNAPLDANEPRRHIETAQDVDIYRKQVEEAQRAVGSKAIVHYLIKMTPRTTRTIVKDAMGTGAIGMKEYPDGVTNNSEGGITAADFTSPQFYGCLHELQDQGGIYQKHPEMPGNVFCMRRECVYNDTVTRRHATDFPGLKIFLEHMTHRFSLQLLEEFPNVYGSITGHHKRYTLDDVLGQHAHHCRPNAKEPEDRDELRLAAFGKKLAIAHKVVSITDSAYHALYRKLFLACACAGVFNPAEIALAWLAVLFEKENGWAHFEEFTSLNGCAIYGFEPPSTDDLVTFTDEEWEVPRLYLPTEHIADAVEPFLAGNRLNRRLVV